VNKAAASSALLGKCILLHASARTTVSSQLCQHKKSWYTLFNKQA